MPLHRLHLRRVLRALRRHELGALQLLALQLAAVAVAQQLHGLVLLRALRAQLRVPPAVQPLLRLVPQVLAAHRLRRQPLRGAARNRELPEEGVRHVARQLRLALFHERLERLRVPGGRLDRLVVRHHAQRRARVPERQAGVHQQTRAAQARVPRARAARELAVVGARLSVPVILQHLFDRGRHAGRALGDDRDAVAATVRDRQRQIAREHHGPHLKAHALDDALVRPHVAGERGGDDATVHVKVDVGAYVARELRDHLAVARPRVLLDVLAEGVDAQAQRARHAPVVDEAPERERALHLDVLGAVLGEERGHLADDEREHEASEEHHGAREQALGDGLGHDVPVPHRGERLHRPEQRGDVQLPGAHVRAGVVLAREVVHRAVQARHPVAQQTKHDEQLGHAHLRVVHQRVLLVPLEDARRACDAQQLQQTQEREEVERGGGAAGEGLLLARARVVRRDVPRALGEAFQASADVLHGDARQEVHREPRSKVVLTDPREVHHVHHLVVLLAVFPVRGEEPQAKVDPEVQVHEKLQHVPAAVRVRVEAHAVRHRERDVHQDEDLRRVPYAAERRVRVKHVRGDVARRARSRDGGILLRHVLAFSSHVGNRVGGASFQERVVVLRPARATGTRRVRGLVVGVCAGLVRAVRGEWTSGACGERGWRRGRSRETGTPTKR